MIPGIVAGGAMRQGGQGWSPSLIATECWLDASASATLTLDGSNRVSAWADKSGNGRGVSQGTDASRPARILAGRNGLSVVRFDGSNDQLNWAGGFAQASGQNVFLAGDTTSLGSGWRQFMGRNPATAAALALYLGANSSTARPMLYWASADRAIWSAAVQRAAIFRWHYTLVSGTGTALTQVDEATAVSASFAASTLVDWASIATSASQQPAFDAFEIIVTGAIDQATREKIAGYLAWKWGMVSNLPGGHPYKLAPP